MDDVHMKSKLHNATAETVFAWKINPLQKMVYVPDFVRLCGLRTIHFMMCGL